MVKRRALAQDFALAAQRALGQYTRNVERFLAETAPRYQKRYDAELVSRTPVEYHLSMFGVEVLSHAYRERFAITQRRIVIVPPCMRARPDGVCKAVATPLGARCQSCTPGCAVSAATRLGEQHDFEVYMIPDQLRPAQCARGLGMVGVSCALTNWSGGWDADALGVPAQGVPLDYVGCSYHWHDQGIPTAVNLRELERIATITSTGSGSYAGDSRE